MKLEIENLAKKYGDVSALRDLSLSIEDTRALMLIGPSGGGKSTTLRLLAGLELPSAGSLCIDGHALPRDERSLQTYRKSIGVVFQSYNLFPHLDTVENITLPLLKVHGFKPTDARQRALALLDRFKLSEHANKRPAELSGGQSQRVAIARAIAHDPQKIFFDEPTSALDPEMSAEVLDVIEELIQDGKNCVIVTHQMGFARRAGDFVAFIANGKVVESSPCSEFFTTPSTQQAQDFLARELKY